MTESKREQPGEEQARDGGDVMMLAVFCSAGQRDGAIEGRMKSL